MSNQLEALEPKEFFHFFREISRIPRGSYHVDAISDYLVDFAKERGLEVHQDGEKNVIIIKEASEGCEKAEPLMLQGHMDMVAVKEQGSSHDLLKDPLDLFLEGDLLGARETSLGGDDGVAVAMGLAFLDDETLKHPRLELVITTNEETGMEGAHAIDISCCRSQRMINLDSEDEGIFLAGCAGGVRMNGFLDINREKKTGTKLEISVGGLLGGHSGEEIIKGHANALILSGRIIRHLWKAFELRLTAFEGGQADNVIPRDAKLTFLAEDQDPAKIRELVEQLEKDYRVEWGAKDPGLSLTLEAEQDKIHADCLTKESMEALSAMLVSLPDGVQAMSPDVEGLVETSLNMGTASLQENRFQFVCLIRSSKDQAKFEVFNKLEAILSLAGGRAEQASPYPGWQYRPDSALRKEMVELYEEITGKKAEVMAIHAGLECGLFQEKRPTLDCVSIGPDMQDIHTARERLSVSSTKRCYEYVRAFIERSAGKSE